MMLNKKLVRMAVIITLVSFYPFVALGQTEKYTEDEVRDIYCFERAGVEYDVSPLLLWAIAKKESNFNPRAINNKNSDGSVDVGLMQINSFWRDRLGDSFWKAQADPCFNIRSGAYVLATCFEQFGKNWAGIGCYNAQATNLQLNYAKSVIGELEDELNRRREVKGLEDIASEIERAQTIVSDRTKNEKALLNNESTYEVE